MTCEQLLLLAHSARLSFAFPPPPSLPLVLQGITFDQLRTAVQRVRMSTRTRVQYLEEEVGDGTSPAW